MACIRAPATFPGIRRINVSEALLLREEGKLTALKWVQAVFFSPRLSGLTALN